jgi:hypothetical protein
MTRSADSRWNAELKNMDRYLFLGWDPKIDRWVIYREDPWERDGDRPVIYRVMVVQEPDGAYRDMDCRVIRELQRNDLQKLGQDELLGFATGSYESSVRSFKKRSMDRISDAASYYARAAKRLAEAC